MAITTLTVNGVDIETTAPMADILAALQPKAEHAVTAPKVPQAAAEPKAPVATTKRTTAPKERQARQARQPKAATNGKALWAEITAQVAEGNYDEARRLASVKPDTFGVQAEAAITRHMARTAKPSKVVEPKAEPKPVEPKARPMKDSPVLDKVQPEPTKAEKRAAKQAKAASEAKPRNHKPDCGCVTCPAGVAQRKAAAAPKVPVTAKDVVKPKAAKQPTKKAAKPQQPKAETKAPAAAHEDERALRSEATRITLKAEGEALKAIDCLDVESLLAAKAAYRGMATRNAQVGNTILTIAYDDAADEVEKALAMVRDTLADATK